MTDVQLFPKVDRGHWADDELAEAVQSASAHVRYLLRELSESEEVRASDLKSKRVAYAIVQRICNSSGKDSLVVTTTDPDTGEKVYRLNPDYRRKIGPLVRDADVPPPTPARPPKPRRNKSLTGMGRGGRNLSATDGIADPRGIARVRQVTQTTSGRSIAFPEGSSLEFCQQLMEFLNTTSSGTRYRVVLDGVGLRLEVAH